MYRLPAGCPMCSYRFGVLLVAGLGCALAVHEARADIYKWADEFGVITYSNSAPKDRSRILEVFPSGQWSEPQRPAPPEAASAAQQRAELRALTERLDRVTGELEAERAALAA